MRMPISLYQLFRTPTQVRIIEELLKNPNEYFTISKMAKLINASPSAVSSKIERLSKLGIVKIVGPGEKAKIFRLNPKSPIVKALIEFVKTLENITEKAMEESVSNV